MKSLLISPVLWLLAVCVNAQNNKSITIGTKEIIYSRVLIENRTTWIYTPNSTSQSVNPGKRYPILYLLDGDAHFFSAVGIIQQLSQANGNAALPVMMVVAIENTDRLRDLGALQSRKYSPVPGKLIGLECTNAVENVDEIVERVKSNGGQMLMPKTAIPYVGWITKFLDTEGNLVCAMQYDNTARCKIQDLYTPTFNACWILKTGKSLTCLKI